MISNSALEKILFFLIICTLFCLLYVSIALCQYWTVMPPYNTLWPLWSQALSPLPPVFVPPVFSVSAIL